MSIWRTIALVVAVAVVGAAGTLVAGALVGMNGTELQHLVLALAPVALVTVVAALLAARLLRGASLRQRFVAVALVAAVVAMTNVAALSMQMFVSDHDATLVTVLLLYAVGAGVGAALAIARNSGLGLSRLRAAAVQLADGELGARAGRLDAGGPELQELAHALDTMAERVQLALEQEHAAERMRRDLITAVSHDLRTPLASLRAMVEALDEGIVDEPADVRRYAHEMRRSTEQLVNLVDDLFELSQLDSGTIASETRRARLDELVDRAVGAVTAEATRRRVAMAVELGGAGHALCSPRIARVIQNLLSNAVRHTPTDGTVHLSASAVDGHLHLVVHDEGDGIDAADLPRVFEPFFRADPARSGPGAGLGLTLAKRIVETLGGTISVRSTPHEGATFAVEVPAA